MKKNNKKAFTLVELLVVIAILAILATVSVVGYSSFTKQAKASNSEQEMSQIKTMLLADWLDGYVGDASAARVIAKNSNKNYNINVNVTQEASAAVYAAAQESGFPVDGTTYYTKSGDVYSKAKLTWAADTYYTSDGAATPSYTAAQESGFPVDGTTYYTRTGSENNYTYSEAKLTWTADTYFTQTSPEKELKYETQQFIADKLLDALKDEDVGTLKTMIKFKFVAAPTASGVELEAVHYVAANGYTAVWDISEDTIKATTDVAAITYDAA